MAAFLGNEAEARTWLVEYERKAAGVKAQVTAVVGDKTVLVLHMHRDSMYLYGEKTVAGVLYQDLGLSSPNGVAALSSHAEVTLERMAELDADWILLMFSDGSNPRARWEQLRHTEG